MGKKYDAYKKAVKAEDASKARWILEPTDQNRRDAEQAEMISNATLEEFKDDPTG